MNSDGEELRSYETPALLAWRRGTDIPLLVLAIGSLPILLLEIQRTELPYSDELFLDIVNWTVLVAFTVDYVVEFVLSSWRSLYVRREWTSLLIVLSQAVAVVPSLGPFGILRAFRGARALRAVLAVMRLFAIGGVAAREGRRILVRHAASFALAAAGLTWLCSAVAFTLAENVGNGYKYGSFFDALWWSTATITTIGAGAIAPTTTAGRLVGALTGIVGISTFAVVTAKVAQFLVRVDPQRSDTTNA
jgi:voltage-gated potassium channel